jgi:hypothetical protein
MNYTCIRIEGGLLSPDILEHIHDMEGQKPKDFNLESRRTIVDELTSAWSDARSFWDAFQRRIRRGTESATTITREAWIMPLLEDLLGYKLSYQRSASTVDGRSYSISHRAGSDESAPPVHIVGTDQELGSRPSSGRGFLSPHALVQDYLNRTDHLWGIVTNGNTLRFLRDSSYFTRSAYVEFDLKQMLEGERLDEFILFYRLAHRTRFPIGIADMSKCLLENYHQYAIEQGGRIRDKLSEAVKKAIIIFANGFLNHKKNNDLQQRITSGEITSNKFYQQILYLVYRLLFLMVAEERNTLTDSETYRSYFSIARLRELSTASLNAPGRFDDLYLGLRTLFEILRDDKLSIQLGLPPLNGDLFKAKDIDNAFMNNRDLLNAVNSLSYFISPEDNVPRRVNYSALDVEELGSVYESLLDYQPFISVGNTSKMEFEFIEGTERKTTGSYYTKPELVNELINSALVPVIEDRLNASKDKDAKEKALLSLKVCDPACGSGHFLLAVARRIGRELAKVKTGDDEPSPERTKEAIRDVIIHCIYGVDKNPLAVDLCKVALWIEGYVSGKPLTFLDHRVRCGDSLVGMMDMEVLKDGIPDDAYNPVASDEKAIATELKRRNKNERQTLSRLIFNFKEELKRFKEDRKPMLELPDDKPEVIRQKMQTNERIHSAETKWYRYKTACDLWTSAFFAELTQQRDKDRRIPTTNDVYNYLDNKPLDARLTGYANALSNSQSFFHWQLEFPEVFDDGGFDVVLCNPPWEMIQLEEQEFFSIRDPQIANAPNASARSRLINQLQQINPNLWQEYQQALHDADSTSKFLRSNVRFPLTGRGRINTYSVFTEHLRSLISAEGRAGIVVPTGIATDDTNKFFFADTIESNALISLYDFENREALFLGVHRSYKFSLLTMAGIGNSKRIFSMQFAFFLTQPSQLRDESRTFSLTSEDFNRLNPNTKTCPIFRTRIDAELTSKIYERVPVLVNETINENPWGISFKQGLFNMSSDSGLFRTQEQMLDAGYELVGNRFIKDDEVYLPLYEAKMIWHFDHRFGSYESRDDSRGYRVLPPTPNDKYCDANYIIQPWYWVNDDEVQERLRNWNRTWLLGFRDVTSGVTERTAVFSLLPRIGVGHTTPLMFINNSINTLLINLLLANFNSLVLDYLIRQKIGGIHLTYGYIKQFPVLPPSAYSESDQLFIVPRVLELVYTSWDIVSFADDVWKDSPESLRSVINKQWDQSVAETGSIDSDTPDWAIIDPEGIPYNPAVWNEDRRARIRAELDAYYARLYGLTEEELRYILDPQDVYGEDFPGETFRVLKEKEIRKYGEYRTKRLVLEAWEKLSK